MATKKRERKRENSSSDNWLSGIMGDRCQIDRLSSREREPPKQRDVRWDNMNLQILEMLKNILKNMYRYSTVCFYATLYYIGHLYEVQV